MRTMDNRQHLGREISIAANQFRRTTDRIIENRVGLTAAQTHTLHFIMIRSQDGSVYQKDIEREFDLRSPSVTSMLKQLEAKGLIVREPDEHDGRLKRIVLTPEAMKIQEQICSCLMYMEEEVGNCLSREEKTQLIVLLRKVSEKVSEMDKEG